MLKAMNQVFKDILAHEKSRWILWLPVGLALGIGVYFGLPKEPAPSWLLYGGLCLGALLIWAPLRGWSVPWGVICLGFCAAWLKTVLLDTPQLIEEMGPVLLEGTLEKIDQRPKDVRLTLGDLNYDPFVPFLKSIRLSCKGNLGRNPLFEPGQRLRLKAMLLPPQEPAHPYGYNFRRQAYFEGLGAVGYCLKSPEIIDTGLKERYLSKLRYRLTQFLRTYIGGVEGNIAAALVTGDRSGIPQGVRDAYADAGIAHVLAISGLHLSLVAGFFFVLFRTLFAFIPFLALRFPMKKVAALWALVGVLFYLIICAAPIPALRSFMMTSLVLGGVIVDRFALSLRNVALAATGILLFLPESLLSPSFQLSFAAVVILVAGYERYYGPLHSWVARNPWWGKSFVLYSSGIVLSSLLSTIATTPYVVYTFHHFTLHSIPANMIVIPLMSFFIMPLLAILILLWPLSNLVGLPEILKYLLALMNQVAFYVGSWKGSHVLLKAMPLSALIFMTFGLLVYFLVKHKSRYGGVLLGGIGIMIMYYHPIPDLFVSRSGKLIGIHDPGRGLVVNTLAKERFARKSWMIYCGQTQVQKDPTFLEGSPHIKKIFHEIIAQKAGATYGWNTGQTYDLVSVRDTEGYRPWSFIEK
jgi:competence protein ComEC